MFRSVFSAFVLVLLGTNAAYGAPDKYQLDKDHTHILFFVSHVGFSDSIGRFNTFDGYFTFDEKEPEASVVDVTVKSASIDTGIVELDKVLKSGAFLNTDKFPTVHFKSTSVKVTGNHTGDITGDLTLLGVTKPAVLHVKYNRSGIHPFTNNYVSGFSADVSFNRSDFGMKAYIPAVGDEVRIHIELEGTDPLLHPGNVKTPH